MDKNLRLLRLAYLERCQKIKENKNESKKIKNNIVLTHSDNDI